MGLTLACWYDLCVTLPLTVGFSSDGMMLRPGDLSE